MVVCCRETDLVVNAEINFASDLINWIKFMLPVKARQDICLPFLTYQIFVFIEIKMANTKLIWILPFLTAPLASLQDGIYLSL